MLTTNQDKERWFKAWSMLNGLTTKATPKNQQLKPMSRKQIRQWLDEQMDVAYKEDMRQRLNVISKNKERV